VPPDGGGKVKAHVTEFPVKTDKEASCEFVEEIETWSGIMKGSHIRRENKTIYTIIDELWIQILSSVNVSHGGLTGERKFRGIPFQTFAQPRNLIRACLKM
jgi:hypothetical protein